jgi:hypothetical protein
MIEQHTPGPWGVLSTAVGPAYTAVCIGQLNEEKGLDGASDEYAVCVVPLIHDESRANARLIAAAPDLLTALEEVLPHVEFSHRPFKAEVAAARAAIAKATGQ